MKNLKLFTIIITWLFVLHSKGHSDKLVRTKKLSSLSCFNINLEDGNSRHEIKKISSNRYELLFIYEGNGKEIEEVVADDLENCRIEKKSKALQCDRSRGGLFGDSLIKYSIQKRTGGETYLRKREDYILRVYPSRSSSIKYKMKNCSFRI